MRIISMIAACILLAVNASAGGPAFVAGSSYFDPTVKGSPVVWAQGTVTYYTDQGNLSPTMSGAAADFFVASAFSQWTSIPTVAISAVRGGQGAENVPGANVPPGHGKINLPPAIQPREIGTTAGVLSSFAGSCTD